MQEFNDYIRQRLENNGYRCKQQSLYDVFMSVDDKPIWICYLNAELEPEQIRRCFDFPGHVLFVVNEKLIPQEIKSREETPMWLRVIHGLYMGRIYVWNGRYLFGLHFDYDTGDINESGIIQPDDLLLTESGTWLRGWTGIYKLARFYDRAWWAENSYPKGSYDRGQSNARSEYEQARDRYQEQQRARENAQSNYQWRYRDMPPNEYPPGNASSKPDFMRDFARAGSPSAVKALYRELAKKYHPDLNPGVDTTETMQAVNAAYERYK